MRGWLAALATLAIAGSAGQTFAQAAPPSLVGTYNGGQTEVGTELRLEANGRFEYYLAYGALDEMAEGTWTADANGLVLTSVPVKAPAFQLLESKAGSDRDLIVTLDVPKGMDVQYFSVFELQPDGTVSEQQFPPEGPLRIPMTGPQAPSKIAVALSLFQVASQPYDLTTGKRDMHFRFIPNDLGKVAFDHHRLPRDGDAFVLQRFDLTLRYRKEMPGQSGEKDRAGEN